MKKMWMLIVAASFTSFGYSQATEEQVEKQIRDPQRKANAGKADAIIANKKAVYDSTTFNNTPDEAINNKTVKASTKKKHCGNKIKHSRKATTSKKKT